MPLSHLLDQRLMTKTRRTKIKNDRETVLHSIEHIVTGSRSDKRGHQSILIFIFFLWRKTQKLLELSWNRLLPNFRSLFCRLLLVVVVFPLFVCVRVRMWLPGQLHGDLSGLAEPLLDLDVELAEHDLLAVRVIRVLTEHVTKGQRCHHGRRLVQDAGHTFDGLPHAGSPFTAAARGRVVTIATLLGPFFLLR